MRVSSLLASAASDSRRAVPPRGLPLPLVAAALSGGRVALLPVAVIPALTVSAATAAAAAAAAGATREAKAFAFAAAFAAIGRPAPFTTDAVSGAATVMTPRAAAAPVAPSSSESS